MGHIFIFLLAQGEKFYHACQQLASMNGQAKDLVNVKLALGSMKQTQGYVCCSYQKLKKERKKKKEKQKENTEQKRYDFYQLSYRSHYVSVCLSVL